LSSAERSLRFCSGHALECAPSSPPFRQQAPPELAPHKILAFVHLRTKILLQGVPPIPVWGSLYACGPVVFFAYARESRLTLLEALLACKMPLEAAWSKALVARRKASLALVKSSKARASRALFTAVRTAERADLFRALRARDCRWRFRAEGVLAKVALLKFNEISEPNYLERGFQSSRLFGKHLFGPLPGALLLLGGCLRHVFSLLAKQPLHEVKPLYKPLVGAAQGLFR